MKTASTLGATLALTLGTQLIAGPVVAAATDEPLTQSGYITGTMKADFQTQRPENRDGDYPMRGVPDRFAVDLAVGYTKYRGNVTCLPHIFSKHIGRVLQDGSCIFDLNLSVMNPQNTSQVRDIGKLVGSYAVDDRGQVNLSGGNLRTEVQTMGKAQGFTSAFSGSFTGKPPKKVTTLTKIAETAERQTRTIEKMINGKKVSVALADVDPVRFSGTTLAMGPVATYPGATVDGELIYSYETDNWFPQLSVRVGNNKPDTIGGGMKWVDDGPAEGHYELNIVFNEQIDQGEAAAFSDAQGEDAFFMTDDTQSAIKGRIDFKDRKIDEAVVQSDVKFAIDVQKISPIQAQNFLKILLLLPEQLWGE
jgi:hypothetical protein